MAVKGTFGVTFNSSATYKWGVLVLDIANQWQTCMFFKSEKDAKRYAFDLGVEPVLIARRFDRLELRGSWGVA